MEATFGTVKTLPTTIELSPAGLSRAVDGAGLAAPQVGVGLQIAVVEVEPGNDRRGHRRDAFVARATELVERFGS